MELNEYQDRAMSTCMPSCNNISNLEKLADREQRGVIDGNGDNR